MFAGEKVEYLGHIISANEAATDPQKIAAVKEWPVPVSTTQLRSVLGFTGYYRRFIQDYGLSCRPLHDMLKKKDFNGPNNKQLRLKSSN